MTRHSADRRELYGEWNTHTNGHRGERDRQLSKLDDYKLRG